MSAGTGRVITKNGSRRWLLVTVIFLSAAAAVLFIFYQLGVAVDQMADSHTERRGVGKDD